MQEARARGLFRNASPAFPYPYLHHHPYSCGTHLALWGVRLWEIGDRKDELKLTFCGHQSDLHTLLPVSWVPDLLGTTYGSRGEPDACLKVLTIFTMISLPFFSKQMGAHPTPHAP